MTNLSNPSLRNAAHRKTTLLITSLLWITGAVWLLLQWSPSDILYRLHEYVDIFLMQGWLMRLHGLLGMLFLILLGMLWQPHIRTAWHRKLSRRSGSLLFGGMTVLCITGYGVYYFIGEWREWNRYLHWIVGMAIPLAIACHLPFRSR